MSNYPAPREIPAGKVILAELSIPSHYKDVIANRAHVEKIDEKPPGPLLRHNTYDNRVVLAWSSPGYECAGAMMRWTNGFWAVWWMDRSYARQGRRYRLNDEGETKAREHFAMLTRETENAV